MSPRDLQFFQFQARGPIVWGDLELSPNGDLALLDRDEDVDVQDATIRLLTDQGFHRGFASFPGLGASLSKYVGQPATLDTLQQIDRSCERALRADKRFSSSLQTRTIQTGPDSARIYVMRPNADGSQDILNPKVEFSVERGIAPLEEKRPSPWLWRRGVVSIQQSAGLWRAWSGGNIIWRLTAEGLVTRKVREASLDQLGLFAEPLSVLDGGLLFCGLGPTPGLYYPRAYTKIEGWDVTFPMREVDSLPRRDLPDGVWCDEETGWDILIIIGGQTAGQFSEARNRWEFIHVKEVDTL